MASIYKRGKGWAVRISYRDNGQKKRLNKSGFKTRPSAKAWAVDQESRLNHGGPAKYSQDTLVEYFQYWFDTFKAPRLAPATYRRYMATKNVLDHYFHNQKVSSIDFMQYQKFINDFGQTHTKATVEKVHNQTRGAIKKAYQMHQIPQDFTEGAAISGLNGKRADEKYLDVDDMKKLLTYCEQHIEHITDVSKAMIVAGLLTGMRYEELIGLTWDCVDFDEQTVTVNKAYIYTDQEFGPTKNEQSKRIIKVDGELIDILKQWQDIVNAFIAKNAYLNPKDFVFYGRYRSVISNKRANTALRMICRELHLEKEISFHGLRHTHASYLISQGVSLQYIAKRLGHKNTIVTQTVYAHLLQSSQTEQEDKTVSIFDKLHQDQKDSDD
ncbi:tyrosine recombinase XerC [Lentilactobacillus sunkii]|uniref:Tyrosine recombinase XerC n=1 Tax=Lentilactobacillus sunkii TaxID=481719 RepID=A0A1E7XCH3_9LACO|nr:site-specific integrase [Lentilactobacillus sunkii]OFA10804.1 tyrosine recombinase XerC [Lentilactobacillus sunkii]